jgi:hypothetical protein
MSKWADGAAMEAAAMAEASAGRSADDEPAEDNLTYKKKRFAVMALVQEALWHHHEELGLGAGHIIEGCLGYAAQIAFHDCDSRAHFLRSFMAACAATANKTEENFCDCETCLEARFFAHAKAREFKELLNGIRRPQHPKRGTPKGSPKKRRTDRGGAPQAKHPQGGAGTAGGG